MSALSAATTSEPVIVGSLLYGADKVVADLVKSRIEHMRNLEWGPYTAIGVIQNNRLIGGVVFHWNRGFDVAFGASFDTRTWARPDVLRALFDYPFNQLGCIRLTAMTFRKNMKARKLLTHLGFKFEGVARKALDGKQDGYVYSLLREECKWL